LIIKGREGGREEGRKEQHRHILVKRLKAKNLKNCKCNKISGDLKEKK
jgi:hypothetical protein